MITKYNTKRQSQLPRTFEIGDYVTVFIPRQDRSASDDRRLPARIHQQQRIFRQVRHDDQAQ